MEADDRLEVALLNIVTDTLRSPNVTQAAKIAQLDRMDTEYARGYLPAETYLIIMRLALEDAWECLAGQAA